MSGALHPAAAGGAQAEETALRDAYRAETDRLLGTRLDLTVVLFLVCVGGSVVIEATQVPARLDRYRRRNASSSFFPRRESRDRSTTCKCLKKYRLP